MRIGPAICKLKGGIEFDVQGEIHEVARQIEDAILEEHARQPE